ncbi:MAG TPA: hypothetical protein VH500_01995 [Nitrososphaeraceae archaeon]
MIQNSFPMMEWHAKHLEKMVLKYVTGLAENATSWEKRNNKRYGRIGIVCRQINYDIKHGATHEQVVTILQKIRNDSSFCQLRANNGSLERLGELEKYYEQQPVDTKSWWY